MRENHLWTELREAMWRGAASTLRRRQNNLLDPEEIEDVVSTCLISFWQKTPPSTSRSHQLRRAWHFGANGMRNHLRARLNPNSPLNPALAEPADALQGDLQRDYRDPERRLQARQALERLQAALCPRDQDYLMGALTAESFAAFANDKGVDRSAVTQRLNTIRLRARRALEAPASPSRAGMKEKTE